jgi:hypothetical protein
MNDDNNSRQGITDNGNAHRDQIVTAIPFTAAKQVSGADFAPQQGAIIDVNE